MEFFEIKDVKMLKGEYLFCVIGRLFGKGGKMKFVIENFICICIVIVDIRIYILGFFVNI